MPDPFEALNDALDGRYRVVGELGSGGMATVYLAEQFEPVQRRVALKIVAETRTPERFLDRFLAERQALARMDHPGIAKIFDAGVTRDGRPYFAMEVVEGRPIVEFCDERRLGLDDRVRVFIDVCHAVQHAHQKGVIHRDLKPSNVMVSEVDDHHPLPRIIDFGIAKAAEPDGFDGTELTREDEFVGTPAYMSPEQIEGSRDIDTRSDIYALGVLLYELLVGALPYRAEAYRGWIALATQLTRDPPSLAQRFDALTDEQREIAAHRGVGVTELRRTLAGDLAWIVAEAMARDRDERYDTVEAMLQDLERYLAHQPIRARAATAGYVVRKFVRRNRVAVGFGAVLLMGLVGFAASMTIQAERIARARDEADARRVQAEGLIDFMLGDLRSKLEPLGRLDLLDDVGQEAVAYFASLPEDQYSENELLSRSQALYQIGSVRLNEGRFADAQDAFGESLRLAQALAERDPSNADWLFGLSQSHFWVGYAAWLRRELDTAEEEFEAYMEVARELVTRDSANATWQLELGYAHSNLGSVREARYDLEGALDSFRETLAIKQRIADRDPDDPDARFEVARGHNKVGLALLKLGDLAGAEREFRADVEITTGLVATDPANAIWQDAHGLGHMFVGDVLEDRGRPEAALESYRASEAVFRELVARDPANAEWRASLAIVLRNVGATLSVLGPDARGRTTLQESRALFETLVELDPDRAGFRRGLALTYVTLGLQALDGSRIDEAGSRAEGAVALLQEARTQTADDPETLWLLAEALLLQGAVRQADGSRPTARASWEEALAVTLEPAGRVHPPDLMSARARAFHLLGREAEATALADSLGAIGYAAPAHRSVFATGSTSSP